MDIEIARELIGLLGNATDSALYGVVIYFVYKVLGLSVIAGAVYGVYRTVNCAIERHSFSFRICRVLEHDWIPDAGRGREEVLSTLYQMKKLSEEYEAAQTEKATTGSSAGPPSGIINV